MDYQEAIEYLEHRKKLEAMPLSPMLEGKTAHVEAYKIAISAMQELQLYKDGKLCLIPDDVYTKQCAELDEYKQIGTLEELKQLKELEFTALDMANIACALNRLQKYEQLGTLDEVRAAVEKQRAK